MRKRAISGWKLFSLLRLRLKYVKEIRIREQRSEVGGRRSDVRSLKSEVGGQKAEVGGRRSEVRNQKSGIREQRSEVGSRRSDVREQKTEVGSQKSEAGRTTMDEGRGKRVRGPQLNSLRSSSSKPRLNISNKLVSLGKNLTGQADVGSRMTGDRGRKSVGCLRTYLPVYHIFLPALLLIPNIIYPAWHESI